MFALRRAATALPRTSRSLYTLNNSLGALRPAVNASLKPSKLNHWRAMSNFAGETQRAFIQRMSNEACAHPFLTLFLCK
jgi:Tfp pilus assembly protein PilN